MRRSKWILLSAAILAVSCLQARAATGGRTETVGEFAFRVSLAIGGHPAGQAAAVAALRKAGVDLGHDVGAPLTAGRAAGILRDLGIKVGDPAAPAATISEARALQIVRVVALSRGPILKPHDRNRMEDCHVSSADPEDCDEGDDDDQGGDHDGDHHGDDD